MDKIECIYDILREFSTDETKIEEYILIIRKKLTKKEYKILLYGCKESSIQDIASRLNLDIDRYQKLYKSALAKIDLLIKTNQFN